MRLELGHAEDYRFLFCFGRGSFSPDVIGWQPEESSTAFLMGRLEEKGEKRKRMNKEQFRHATSPHLLKRTRAIEEF